MIHGLPDGYALFKRYAPGATTRDVANGLGSVIEIATILPWAQIPTVQTLQPRESTEVGRNQYSGHYGREAFPLHSDLAHWPVPPRYLLLRCVVGSSEVATNVLLWKALVARLGTRTLQRAIFTHPHRRRGCSGLVRAAMSYGDEQILRWDGLFLRPLNAEAAAMSAVMREPRWTAEATPILLSEAGDTLLIDNWQMLHGRSSVPPSARGRRIERIYLAEVFR